MNIYPNFASYSLFPFASASIVASEALCTLLCSPEAPSAVEAKLFFHRSVRPLLGCCLYASFQSSSVQRNHCSSASSNSSTRPSAGKKGSILFTHAEDPQQRNSSSFNFCLGTI